MITRFFLRCGVSDVLLRDSHPYISGDNFGPFVMRFFALFELTDTARVDLFGFSPSCCELDSSPPQMAIND